MHRSSLVAPLAVYDEDIDDEVDEHLREIEVLLSMNHSSHHVPRRFSRQRNSIAAVVPESTFDYLEQFPNARKVQIRLVFIHIGEIDTLNEKYQADIYFEARWTEHRLSLNTLNLTSQQQTQLYENAIVKINDFDRLIKWSPQLFIENAIAQIGGQERWFTIKKGDLDLSQPSSPLLVNLDICEHRRIKGVFWEKLELNHFPADVQDLSISITSHHPMESCILVQDQKFLSFINREAFTDQQEWSLYEHVATEERRTQEEYSFEDGRCGDGEKNHSVLVVICRAARRPGYYYWNGFCLIFLITLCSFCIFAIPPNLPQNRLQITCTLVLTSITFRWVVNRSLPQISYLTTLDIYAIVSIVILVCLCIWHSIIAVIIFYSIPAQTLRPSSIYVHIDRYLFVFLFSIYTMINAALIVWLIRVPYRRRRVMEQYDREYCERKRFLSPNSQLGSKQDLVVRRSSSVFDPVPTLKMPRTMRPSDGVTVIPNGLACAVIPELPDGSSTKAMDIVELREQDEK